MEHVRKYFRVILHSLLPENLTNCDVCFSRTTFLPHELHWGELQFTEGATSHALSQPEAPPPLWVASTQDHSSSSSVTTDFMDALRPTLRSDATGSLVQENINKHVKLSAP